MHSQRPQWRLRSAPAFPLRRSHRFQGQPSAGGNPGVPPAHTAVTKLDAKFAAIIGTPVPAVIGTDYHALKRMTEKKVDLPILTVDTDGMELYDKGEEKAWKELFLVFAGEKEDVILGRIGILGMTPQDISDLRAADRIRERFAAEGKTAVCFGMGNGLDDVKSVSNVEKNIVVSPAALEAAKYLERTYGTPYETGYPLVDELVYDMDYHGKKVLIVQQDRKSVV